MLFGDLYATLQGAIRRFHRYRGAKLERDTILAPLSIDVGDEYLKAILIESVFDFGTFEVGEDDGHLQEISLAIDLAYLGIILLGYLALFGNQEKERIFYFYNIRKAACKTWAFCVSSPAMSHE